MTGLGGLILFSAVAAYVCAKSNAAGGAVVFSLIGVCLFLSTPAGGWVPDALSVFVHAVDRASEPVLTGDPEAGPGPEGGGR